MYLSWIESNNEKLENERNNSILVGSFSNPEAAQRMLQKPTAAMTDEDFEKLGAEIDKLPPISKEKQLKKKKKRKILKQ